MRLYHDANLYIFAMGAGECPDGCFGKLKNVLNLFPRRDGRSNSVLLGNRQIPTFRIQNRPGMDLLGK